jgi:hypothetical protein
LDKISFGQLLGIMQEHGIHVGPNLHTLHMRDRHCGGWVSGPYDKICSWHNAVISAEHDMLASSFNNLHAAAMSETSGGSKDVNYELNECVAAIESMAEGMPTIAKRKWIKEISDTVKSRRDVAVSGYVYFLREILDEIHIQHRVVGLCLDQATLIDAYGRAFPIIEGPMIKAADAGYTGTLDSSPAGWMQTVQIPGAERVFSWYGPDGIAEEDRDREKSKRDMPMYFMAKERAKGPMSKYWEINMGTAFEFGDYMRDMSSVHGRWTLWNSQPDKDKMGMMGLN